MDSPFAFALLGELFEKEGAMRFKVKIDKMTAKQVTLMVAYRNKVAEIIKSQMEV